MYDETIRYCKIFKGPVEELYDDCFELGFSSNPSVAECKTAVDPVNNDQCDVNFYIYVRYCVVIMIIINCIYGFYNLYHFYSILDKIIAATKGTF